MKYIRKNDGVCAEGASMHCRRNPEFSIWDAAKLYEKLFGTKEYANIRLSPGDHTVAFASPDVYDYTASPKEMFFEEWKEYIEKKFRGGLKVK